MNNYESPFEAETTANKNKAVRGGSFYDAHTGASSTFRFHRDPDFVSSRYGLRLAISLEL